MLTLHTPYRAVRRTAGVAATLLLCAHLPLRAQGVQQFTLSGPMGDMVGKMRQSRSFSDPGVSGTSNLLTRSDVRNELALNGRQTEALTDLQNGYPAAMAQPIMSLFQKMMSEGGGNPRDMSPEDQKAFGEQMRVKVQETQFAVQGEQDKKAEAVLTPAQAKRLRELDLQWRGPLALTDSALTAKLPLTADQQAKFTAMLREYRNQQQAARAGMFGMGPRNAPGGARTGTGRNNAKPSSQDAAPKGADAAADAAPPMPPTPGGRFVMPNPEQMQAQIEEQDKQITTLRKGMDAKALALLTPEQQQQWKAMQGRPFTFRANL